jgi:hypothetical protein
VDGQQIPSAIQSYNIHTSGQYDAFGHVVPAPDGPTNVNSNSDIYATAPIFMRHFVNVGDQATYTNTTTGASWTAPVMDYSPKFKGFGEASVAGANALEGGVVQGYNKQGTPIGPVTSGTIQVTVTYYPGTAVRVKDPILTLKFGLSLGP